MLPNTIAPAGHAWAQAVVKVPSGTTTFPDGPALTFCAIFACSMRCTQYVHFSMTPRLRTVTSGFFCILTLSVTKSEYRKKLNRRTL
jgi:hypothetical protein